MKPSKEKVVAELKNLRRVVEDSKCPFERRIAYAMEHAIRWATEDTVGWNPPHKDAADDAMMLKSAVQTKGTP